MAAMMTVKCSNSGFFKSKRHQRLPITLASSLEPLDLACMNYSKKKRFPKLFDWIIFDESSQMLTSNALISLIFGKGQALFYGDTKQLSPILMENYANTSLMPCSILQELTLRYGSQNRVCLDETYRMSDPICRFASEQWYDGNLRSAVAKNNQHLSLSNYPLYRDELDKHLDPSQVDVVSGDRSCWIPTVFTRRS